MAPLKRFTDRTTVPDRTGREKVGSEPAEPEPAEPAPAEPAPAGRAPGPRRAVPRTVWFAVALGVLAIAGALSARIVMAGFADLNPFRNGIVQQRTVDRSGPAVLKAVTELGDLQAASGYYEIVIDVERSVDHVPSVLSGRRVLFVAAGTVDAEVDLRSLGDGAVTVNEDRTSATLRLPRPRLSEPHLDVDRSYVYDEERGLVDRIGDTFSGTPDLQSSLYQLASRRLGEAAAANDDLSSHAESSARTVLQGLLRPLGFTDVTVTFTD